MAIDIRATVTCSLGTLISASVSDDYLQGAGLIKTKGSCEISGTITPAIGTVVTFSYTKGGVTRTVPRKLRVLSSFADPFRRTTKVELGCKLTYLQDLREPINWKALDDPANAGYTSADTEVITVPIHASSVMDKCLTELGITASSHPLTNKFSIGSFDFGPGYVQVLNDLLVSESYCGYLDTSEVLQVFSLDQEGGTGPVVASTQIIDLGPIGVGQLPGEAVTVSYSTLKLKGDDATASNWETNQTSNVHTVPVPYQAPSGNATAEYRVLDTAIETTLYQTIEKPSGEQVRVPASRTTVETTGSVAILGALVSEYLTNNLEFNNVTVTKTTQENFYYDDYGIEIFYTKDVSGSSAHLIGGLGVPFVFSATDYVAVNYGNTSAIEYVYRATETAGEYQKVLTQTYGTWPQTIAGQQTIAASRDSFTTAAEVVAYIDQCFPQSGGLGNRGLYLLDSTTSTQYRADAQTAPDQATMINSANAAATGDPGNGGRTESKAELQLALGSATAQRRTEFSLPYAPDDVFIKNAGPPITYSSTPSDAAQKATQYGRVQNRLLMGNRSGMNLQLAPETLPDAPFAPLVVQANGLSALYRTNAASWTMDSNGIVASTDALFWGAVGGTGTFWFPVAPGITALPTTPAVVDGQMTVSATVPVWNETVLADARTRVGLEVQSLAYPLELLTEVGAESLRLGITAQKVVQLSVGATNVGLAALVPAVSTGTRVSAPATEVALLALAPAILGGKAIAVPASQVGIAALAPDRAGAQSTNVFVNSTNVAVAALVPSVAAGTSITAPVSNVGVQALVPTAGPVKAISFIGTATAETPTSTAVAPTHAVGDLIVVISSVFSGRPFPSLSGFTQLIESGTFGSFTIKVQYKVATGTTYTVPTWGDTGYGADKATVLVYRNAAIGAYSSNNTSPPDYPALTLTNNDGTSWGLRIFGRGDGNGNYLVPATGYTSRKVQYSASISDSNGVIYNQSQETVAGQPDVTFGATIELTVAA